MYEKIKFGVFAFISAVAGSHLVYKIYEPMSDFAEYVKEAELKMKNSTSATENSKWTSIFFVYQEGLFLSLV